MALGPVQLLVVGFDNGNFNGAILDELRRLREHDMVRLLDLVFVTKDMDGNVMAVEKSDLTEGERQAFGAMAGALVGFGAAGEEGAEAGAEVGAAAAEEHKLADAETWYLADAIPEGTSAGIALLEHRWAIPLRDAILDAGGVPLADTWIHPQDLIAIGAAGAE
jgi:uncharacterized membrane protein